MAALSGGQKAKALYDYEARAQDELSFKRHEIITVLGKDEVRLLQLLCGSGPSRSARARLAFPHAHTRRWWGGLASPSCLIARCFAVLRWAS